MAPKSKLAQANFGFDHGKAVLCSNIHQKANEYKGIKMLWIIVVLLILILLKL
jgi:hypothetical protein